ncbi:MAG: catalytic domain of component of various dehydrogenase complexe, partial [Arthrobacter sp.]|nr:catalytic domain of component of various dehydrogenase complexe [Arthrobacter sp.]
MIKEFRLPDLGEGLTESEIVAWKVGVGDTVSLNQIIAEVETAKAVVELPSPFAGVITALHEQPGTVVEVGKPIVSFEVEGDDGAAPADPAGGQAAKREPNLVGYGAVLEASGRPARRVRNFASPALASPAAAGSARVAAPAVVT